MAAVRVGLAIVGAFMALAIAACGGGSDSGQGGDPSIAVGRSFSSVLGKGAPTPQPVISGVAQWEVRRGTIFRNGEPYFPLGVYYVSHFSPGRERRRSDIDSIAAAGFNFIHTPIREGDGGFLDESARRGVYVAVEFNQTPSQVISAFGNHPAVAALTTYDDIDSPALGISVARAQATNEEYRRAAPRLLTMATAAFPNRYASYLGSAQIFGFQLYPVPVRPIGTVFGQSAAVANLVTARGGAYVPILQAFRQGGARPPAGREFRNMTWQSLVAAKTAGIFLYTYFDKQNFLPSYGDLWDEIQSVMRDIGGFSGVLAGGNFESLGTNSPAIRAAVYRRDGVTLVLLVNLSGESQTYSVGVEHQGEVQLLEGALPGLGVEALAARD